MLTKLVASAAFATTLLLASGASAALVHDYQLNGDLSDSVGVSNLTNNGSTQTATGLTFLANQGVTLGGYSSLGVYSVETRFAFNETTGYRKILDFQNMGSDTGFYELNTALNFYNVATGPTGVFSAGQMAHVVLTRDIAGLVAGYVDGVQQFTFDDSASQIAVIGSNLRFFQDDSVVSGEAASGNVDFIRMYDSALSASDVRTLAAVPEPATWAMMLLGFGGLGAMLRRRRQAGVVAA